MLCQEEEGDVFVVFVCISLVVVVDSDTMSKCYFPRLIKNPNYNRISASWDGELPLMLVPCGKCHACLSQRRRQWVFRLRQESLYSKFTFFLTLTYDDEKFENKAPSVLVKEHLHNFLRRVRYDYPIKYYAIGEYGSKTRRPHYHAVIFIKDVNSVSSIEARQRYDWIRYFRNHWNFGNIVVSDANIKRLNYICHYHTRPKLIELSDGTSGRTFCLMSKGIGLQFMTPERLEGIRTRPHKDVIDYEGNTITLPRYYRKKFDIEPPVPILDTKGFLEQAKAAGQDPFDYLMDLRDKDTRKMVKYNNQEKF